MSAIESLKRFIRFVMTDTRYMRLYPATVQSQLADGTLEVLPDDPTIRGDGMLVRILTGLPNTTVEVAQGARCLIGFLDGDPSKPYVAEWEGNGLVRLGLDGGARPIARAGDQVEVATLPTTPVSGLVQGTLTVPGTPPVVTPIPPVLATLTATIATPVRGLIQAGKPNLLA